MHIFIESAQRTPIQQVVSAIPERCAHHPCRHWFHTQCVLLYCTLSIGIFKSATFSEHIRHVSGLLSWPFLTRFPRTKCHIKGQGFGNKMYISDLFTVVGCLHTAGFKTIEEFFVSSVDASKSIRTQLGSCKQVMRTSMGIFSTLFFLIIFWT